MMAKLRALLSGWLFLALTLALIAEPMVLTVRADDDGDDRSEEVEASWTDDWDEADGMDDAGDQIDDAWQAESDGDGEEDAGDDRRDAQSDGARSGRDRERSPQRTDTRQVSQLRDDDDDDDDDDGCEIEDDDGDPGTDGFCNDQAIVRLTAGADVSAVNADFGSETIDEIAGRRLYLLRLPIGSDEAQFAQVLEADDRVAWAELNFVDQAPEGSPRRFFPSGGDVPRPGAMDQTYAPDLLGMPAVTCVDGRGVTVAVVDTGLDADHPAFAGIATRGAWNAFNGQDGAGNVDDIGNGEDDDGDSLVDEMTGHGTHVAGIVSQIAPGATIMPVRALDSDGLGQAFYLARAIYHVIDQNADVVNLSLGSTANTRIVREATGDALGAGLFVAAAAGNAGQSGPREYPATLDGVFGVAATDRHDRAAEFSSVHPSLDLSAPGVEVVAAFPPNQPPANPLGSEYALWSGTSMATPWVASAAALILEQRPQWTPEQVADRLRTTAAPIAGSPSGMGAGRLDLARAVDCGPTAAGGVAADPDDGATATGKDKDKKKKKRHNGKGKGKDKGKKKGKNRR
jgi:thermitase